jgi:hypothetical protein
MCAGFQSSSIKPGALLHVSLLMLVLHPLQLQGAEQTEPATEPAAVQEQVAEPAPAPDPLQAVEPSGAMEHARDYLSGKITGFASDIDRFFGGDRHFQESNPSVIQMNLTRTTGYGGDRKLELAARANLRLPVTEGRLRLLIETDPEQNIVEAQKNAPVVLRKTVTTPKSLALAARIAIVEESAWHFRTDLGIKFPLPLKPFVRSAGSYSVPLADWRLTAAQSVYWFNTLGVGETSALDLERIWSEDALFRASTVVTWLKDKHTFDLRQDMSFFHTLNDRSVLLYQASAFGVSKPQYQVTDYVLLVDYRYRMHQKWLYFEIIPQLHFPRDRQYKNNFALSMRLEMLFDDSR